MNLNTFDKKFQIVWMKNHWATMIRKRIGNLFYRFFQVFAHLLKKRQQSYLPSLMIKVDEIFKFCRSWVGIDMRKNCRVFGSKLTELQRFENEPEIYINFAKLWDTFSKSSKAMRKLIKKCVGHFRNFFSQSIFI